MDAQNEFAIYKPHHRVTLKPKQLKFCENYISNGQNAKQAALDAGYSENVANNSRNLLLNGKAIKEYLNKRLSSIKSKAKMSLDYKIDKLASVVEKGIPDNNEDLIPEIARLALSAIAEHNKMVGDYAPVKSANLNCNVDIDATILGVAKEMIKDY